MADLATRIAAAKQTAAQNQRMHADANSAISFAQQQLAQIDDELKKMGVNPENGPQELAALDAQLEQTVTEIEAKLAAERAELTTILDLARQAQLIR